MVARRIYGISKLIWKFSVFNNLSIFEGRGVGVG
jgi:hypothetical protein